MSWFTRVVNVFRMRSLTRELDDELRFHIEELTDELMAQGKSREEARREAFRRFGRYAIQREATADVDVARSLESMLKDLRYGARQLIWNPGFTAVAVLSLALGIGANSAIFQLMNALQLRHLPVPDAEQLVAVDAAPDFFQLGWISGRHGGFTYAQFEQMATHQEAFSGLLAFGTGSFNLSVGGEVRYADGLYVTPNFLEVLQIRPALGSWLPADADPRDCSNAGAILDYSFWQREYGGDRSVVGRSISLDGRPLPILGVTPPSFAGLEPERRFDVAIPLCADARRRLANTIAWWLTPIGRLKPTWSLERASAHIRDISPIVFRESQPASYRPDALDAYLKNKLRLVPAHAGISELRREYESPLWILLGSTGLVLLIACANVANLLLARASARAREIALRQVVGASRARLVTQLMSESVLLAGFGTVLGAVLAYLISRALVLFLGGSGAALDLQLAVDWRVVGFTAALGLATCLLFGLTPALRAASAGPADAMRGGRDSTSSAGGNRLRHAFVVSQIALSLVLLVAALLFGQSLRNLLGTETGMASSGILRADVRANLPGFEPERRLRVFQQLAERINALPDVSSAAFALFSPFSGRTWNGDVRPDIDRESTGTRLVWFNGVGPGYFRTLEVPLAAGRDFSKHDGPNAPRVAIVNEEFVREIFGAGDPIGRTFRVVGDAGQPDSVWQVVGLVGDTRYNGLREEQRPIAFFPVAQSELRPARMDYVIRARGAFNSVMTGVKKEMAQIDRGLLVEFQVLEQQIEQTVLRERLMANLSGGFGLLAAILSTIGLYGVMSYLVARRRSEIGVRMALGAGTSDILLLVLRRAGRLVLIGLAVGLAGSLLLSRLVESFLFGLEPYDVTSLALGCALLAATGFAAALIPARRGAGLHPAVVLREE